MRAAEANVERLQSMARYERVAAPFDGVVTTRNTDVGALINAGSSDAAPMFVVSDLKRLRVFINVPQTYAPSIKIGATAAVSAPEYPGRTFAAVVEASARSVDPASGATLMQLGIDNASGDLMPGAYASVHLQLAGAPGVFRLPVGALIFDRHGLSVATVDAKNRVAMKAVTAGARPGRRGRDRIGPERRRPSHRLARRRPRRRRRSEGDGGAAQVGGRNGAQRCQLNCNSLCKAANK